MGDVILIMTVVVVMALGIFMVKWLGSFMTRNNKSAKKGKDEEIPFKMVFDDEENQTNCEGKGLNHKNSNVKNGVCGEGNDESRDAAERYREDDELQN